MKMTEEETGYEDRLNDLDDEAGYEEPKIQMMIDEFWKPKEGDTIKGIYLETRRFETEKEYYEDDKKKTKIEEFFVVVVQGQDRKIYGINQNNFIKQRLADISEGDALMVTFTGQKRSLKSGFNYNTYEVKIKKFLSGSAKVSHPDYKLHDESTQTDAAQVDEDDPVALGHISDITDMMLGMGIKPDAKLIVAEAKTMRDTKEITDAEYIGIVKQLDKKG